jgi:hypothetical protein
VGVDFGKEGTMTPSSAKTVTALVLVSALLVIGPATRTASQSTITISPTVPSDISAPINLQNAAIFAWQEFIALNWPAVPQTGALNTRDFPNTSARFGDPSYTGPLVWHTFRGKVEIFPGTGNPPGYVNNASQSYGYDAPPQYVYAPGSVGTSNGMIPPFGSASASTPWINLDENSEIGLDMMYAGHAPTTGPLGQQILFLAKANRAEYTYVAANGWWTPARFNMQGQLTFAPIINTAAYIAQNKTDPPPGSNTLVSFRNGTIEVKSAWRQLTPQELSSGKFYTTTARYYVQNAAGEPAYIDTTLGLVALHIIQKTPSAPFFVYATFSQGNNLLDVNGNSVETVDGSVVPPNMLLPPLDPNVISKNATSANPANPGSIQRLSPPTSTTTPSNRVFYINTVSTPPPPPTTQGPVALNRREHSIAPTIVAANQLAQAAIAAYNPAAVWQYYKLVSVQYVPYDKPAGITYTGAPGGPDPSTYYQANEVVESNYNLQVFSGKFQGTLNPPYQNVNVNYLITDYNNDGSAFKNVVTQGNGFNMGGCMGCHGNAQNAGSGFSFIFFGGPVLSPDTVGTPNLAKFRRLFLRQ